MTDKELFEKTEKTFNLKQKTDIVNKVFNEGKFKQTLLEQGTSPFERRYRYNRRYQSDTPSGLSTAVNSAAKGVGGAAKGIGKGLGKVFSSLNPFSKQKKLNKQEEKDRVQKNRMNRLDLMTKGQNMYNTGRTADTQYSKDKIDIKDKDLNLKYAKKQKAREDLYGDLEKDLDFRQKEYDFEQKKKANSASPGNQQPNQQQPSQDLKINDTVLVKTTNNPNALGKVTNLLPNQKDKIQVTVKGAPPYAYNIQNVKKYDRVENEESFEQIIKKYR